ncbi:MAG: hypothetical protein ACQETX_06755 [Pseudomonadota bacterium]
MRMISPGRLVALLVILGCGGLLAYLNWPDSLSSRSGAETEAGLPDAPVARCIAEERAQIDRMVKETPELESRRQLFVQRAEARCEATVGSGNSEPPARDWGQGLN